MTLDLALAAVFWSCCALILYTYAGYPLLLFLGSSALELRNAWRRLLEPLPLPADGEPPTVNAEPISVVVAAHNEEADLPGLIESLRRSDYPSGLIEIIVVSDGSTDRTNPYLQSLDLPNLQLVLLPRQQGKANALNQGVARARHQLLLLTDASTRLQPDTIACLARHFADPRVGVVCGALRFLHHPGSRHTEGAYWSYECLLRLMEGRLGATLTASGALYALRKSCFPPLRATAWIEDFLVPMHARHEGYRVLYDPDAWATEIPAPSVAGEFKRRARLAVGSFRCLGTLLRTRLDALTRWAFISHKLLRWCVPFLMLAALLSNAALAAAAARFEPYRALLLLQLLLYALALAGGARLRRAQRLRRAGSRASQFVQGLYFFLAMNAAFLWGFFLFLFDRGHTAWQQVR